LFPDADAPGGADDAVGDGLLGVGEVATLGDDLEPMR